MTQKHTTAPTPLEVNEGKHTAGKWELNGLPNPTKPQYYCLYVKKGGPETIEHIAQITATGLNDKSRVHENAKLIASAPQLKEQNDYFKTQLAKTQNENIELLQALENIYKDVKLNHGEGPDNMKNTMQAAKALLQKIYQ